MTTYEHPSPKKLKGVAGRFIKIPEDFIFADDDKLLVSFCFFSVFKGLNDKVVFSLDAMAEWSGKNPSRSSTGINGKFHNAVNLLVEKGWLSVDKKPSNSKCCTATVNMENLNEACNDTDKYFAVLYIDEIGKILAWNNPNPNDRYMNNDVLLRVFTYMRLIIRRRRNRLDPGDTIQERRARWPEVWSGYYDELAENLGISARAFSSTVDALCEIGLLYAESLPRIKVNNHWVTDQTLFCNAYKREGDMLLAEGAEYYMEEISSKKMKLGKEPS